MPSYGVEAVRYKGRVGSRLTVLHVAFSIPRCLSPRPLLKITRPLCQSVTLALLYPPRLILNGRYVEGVSRYVRRLLPFVLQ